MTRLFFLASDNPLPSGGLKFIYRFAEMAVDLGKDARVLHGHPGFCVTSFEHHALVGGNRTWTRKSRLNGIKAKVGGFAAELGLAARDMQVDQDDIVILPENRLSRAYEIFPGRRKLILCQNPFLALRMVPPKDLSEIVGSISTSEASLEAMRALLPGKPAACVPYWIERDLFSPVMEKARQILFMPRRGRDEARMVFALLEALGALDGWEVVPIDGLPISEVAERMRKALVFLSFAEREGFGLPGAEAIASGCLTIGYTGVGGDEFFSRFGGWQVPHQDVFAYARTVGEVLARYEADPAPLDAHRIENAEALLAHYSEERTIAALSAAFDMLLP